LRYALTQQHDTRTHIAYTHNIHTHSYTHTLTNTHTHIHTHTYTHKHTHTNTHTNTHTQTHTNKQTYGHAWISTLTRTVLHEGRFSGTTLHSKKPGETRLSGRCRRRQEKFRSLERPRGRHACRRNVISFHTPPAIASTALTHFKARQHTSSICVNAPTL
jgi:hypothetical protein